MNKLQAMHWIDLLLGAAGMFHGNITISTSGMNVSMSNLSSFSINTHFKTVRGKYALRCHECGRWAKAKKKMLYSYLVSCKRCGDQPGMVKF